MEYYADCKCGCGEFIAKRIQQVFKTKACRRSYYNQQRAAQRIILPVRNCQQCNVTFQPVRKDQKYCGICKHSIIYHVTANIPVSQLDDTLSGSVVVLVRQGTVISIVAE